MKIAEFSVKNSVLVNLLMFGIFIFGAISMMQMPTELNPEISFNWVFITIVYPGASPAEIESLIIDPLEAEVKDVEKINNMQSTSEEGLAFLLVKFEDVSDSEFRELYADLKAEMDKVDLPDDAEDPIIEEFDSGDFVPVITINLAYSIPEDNAQIIADELEDDLNDINGIAKVQVSGLAEREIWVEVDPVKMNGYHVTFDEIVMALATRNLNVPGGNITFGKTEYLIRSLGEYGSMDELGNTVIRNDGAGDFIRLRDVATINDRREELNILSRTNGEPSITFSISKKSESSSIDLIQEIKALVNVYQENAPDGVTFSWTNDNEVYITRIISILRNNAMFGMLLILVVLFLFLGLRNALLAALGIPISFFLTFIFMNATGYSMNGSTLFALVMVLGIIVDDAIIVIENCHRYRLMGYNAHESAIKGTSEVVSPILSSIGTNIAAFLPLILISGIMGKFMRVIPLVFSLALLASLFEAFFLLPSHYADWTKKSKVYNKGEKRFFVVLRKHYTRLLLKALRFRYFVLIGLIIMFLLSAFMIPFIGVNLFGEDEFDQFNVFVKFPEGTSLQETNRIMKKFEIAGFELPQSEIQAMIVNVGLLQGESDWLTKKNVAQMLFQLMPAEEREHSTEEMMEMMRERIKTISGPTSVEVVKLSGGPPVGKPISIRVQGKYLDEIKAASLALQDSIRTIPGTEGVTDDYPPGKKEVRIQVDEEKAALYGFNTQYVAMNVRYAFDGVIATEYRDGDDEVDVIVKYNEANRSSVDDVLNLQITNPMGQTVALREMVQFEIEPGYTLIRRFEQKRTIILTGEINTEETDLGSVNAKIEGFIKSLKQDHPRIDFEFGGQFEDWSAFMEELPALFMLSLILIFLILGTQFNSYVQPFIILTTVPFALIGAILGLLISGNPFGIVSLYGFVALAGIVVNDAIVLIDFINNRRNREEMNVCQHWRSIISAGRLRLRPIILTSVTTISGLIPMAFGIGGISAVWSPLANVILFGLLVATVLTLFFIPCLVAILDDIKKSRSKAKARIQCG